MSYHDRCDICGKGLCEPGAVHTCKQNLPKELDPERVAENLKESIATLKHPCMATDADFIRAGMLAAYRDVMEIASTEPCPYIRKVVRNRIAALEGEG